jgi:exonuclease III
MKMCTFNVRGLGNYMKRKQLFNWLNLQKYDICLLQETHLNTKQYLKWTADWD